MTGAAPHARIRPAGGRLAAIVLLGPLVGAFVVLLFMFAGQLADLTGEDVVEMGGLVLMMGWIMGLVPAGLAAVILRLVGLARDPWRRLGEAFVIGGLSALLAMPVILPVLFGIAVPPPEAILLFALCGAVALCVTALPGLGPR